LIKEKLCKIIVDNGSCNNIASQELVDRMELKQRRHPNPYKMQWLHDCGALCVSHVVIVPYSIGKYNDLVECDVVPMQACQLLLGRPWLYDCDVQIFGRTNKLAFMYKGEQISLLPLTLEEILKDGLKRKQQESKDHLRVTHKNSEGVYPKPNKTPQPQTTKTKGKEGLVMMARTGDLKELSEPSATFFVLLYKENFLSTNDLPSTLPSVILMCYRNMRMSFQRRYHRGCHLREELNIKLTFFLVLHFQTELHTAPIQRKQKKFGDNGRIDEKRVCAGKSFTLCRPCSFSS